jgi:hypothetical protein
MPNTNEPRSSIFSRARRVRREIVLALLLTVCAVGFTAAAVVTW